MLFFLRKPFTWSLIQFVPFSVQCVVTISGVWTLEQRGEKPKFNVTFESAVPTLTHRAILALEAAGMLYMIVIRFSFCLNTKADFDHSDI